MTRPLGAPDNCNASSRRRSNTSLLDIGWDLISAKKHLLRQKLTATWASALAVQGRDLTETAPRGRRFRVLFGQSPTSGPRTLPVRTHRMRLSEREIRKGITTR